MLTSQDISYSNEITGRVAIAISLGIDGEVLVTMPTYVDFYEFLLEHPQVVCVTEDCDTVNFMSEGTVVETLVTTPLIGSILASNPDILEIVRRNPDNSFPEMTEELRFRGYVVPGWKYDSSGFIAPEDWVLPPDRKTEQQSKYNEFLNRGGQPNV
jgi:hypothetical protein